MSPTLILLLLFPVVIFSYNGRPVVKGMVDEFKLKTMEEFKWHLFLKASRNFSCMAASQNKTLPVDWKVTPECLRPGLNPLTGRPLFNGEKVDTSNFTDSDKKTYTYYELHPLFRCYAAMANLSLEVDYEVPPGCFSEAEFASSTEPGNTNSTDMFTPSINYTQNVAESNCQKSTSNMLLVLEHIVMSIVGLFVIAKIMEIIHDWHRRKFRPRYSPSQKCNDMVIVYNGQTTPV